MPFLEHLIEELQKLATRRPDTRIPGEDYDSVIATVEEATVSNDDEGE
ncbi:MAG: hypothetical protein ISS52_04395 [Dehalococcoidia bacterium]|nr:hypothetical protein [Dehalococcoidia bacterium]